MNTRSRTTLSTVLGLSLVGFCLGAAQAQSGKMMQHKMMHEDMMMDDDDMTEPAPIGYPFAAPGGLHLFHYKNYAHEGMEAGSASMTKEDKMDMREKRMHDRMMHEDMMMDDDDMTEPAPIGYPFAAPGGLHLFHYKNYAHEGMETGSASMTKEDKMDMREKRMHDRMMHEDKMTDEEDDETVEPAPAGYPFAAPGGLHLYHFKNYAHEGLEEGSASMKKTDNAEKMEKKMKRDKTSK